MLTLIIRSACALAMLLSMLPAAQAATSTADARFERLVNRYVEQYFRTHPEDATQAGIHRYDHRVRDMSAAGIAADRALYRTTLKALAAIPATELSPDHAVDRAIFDNELRARLFEIDELKSWQWQSTDYNPTQGLYLLIARDFAPLPQRLKAVKSRLDALPATLQAARQNLKQPPRVFTETAISQNKGAISFVAETLDTFIDQAPAMRAELAPSRRRAIAALQAYGRWLEADLLPRSTGDFRIGKQRFEQKLRFALESDLSADDILARAEAALVQTQADMEATALPLYRQYFPDKSTQGLDGRQLVRAVLDRIADTRPDQDTIVDQARARLAEATAFVREKQLLTLPDTPVQIIVMPEFQRGTSVAYCDSPGAFEKHGATFYAISPPPADWSAARVDSFFREYNGAMLNNLTVHEAMPGHYAQIAIANQRKLTTPVRALVYSGTFVEGWATYAEEFMADAGYGGPEVRMQQLKMRLRLIINAILDQKIHAGTMSEQDAMRLMTESGYQEDGEAAGKWRRAQLTSSQLSTYFVGNQEVTALARDLLARNGGNLLQAHDAMLSHGSLAPRHIRVLMGLPPRQR